MTSYKNMFPSFPTGFVVDEWANETWGREFFVAIWPTSTRHWLIQMEMADLELCANPDGSPEPVWDLPIVPCTEPCCDPSSYEWYEECEGCSE
jgi:hypothetical protein